MPDTFYQILTDTITRESRRKPRVALPDEVAAAFFRSGVTPRPTAPVARPAAARPAVAPASAVPVPPVGGSDWDALRGAVAGCQGCELCRTRTHTVFGEGDVRARLVFVGEGPGYDEDRLGRPFVGAAGQLLDKMIAAMGLAREQVYIANIVKCRPPGNRNPEPGEAAACMGYLRRQLELIHPEVIVTLGKVPLTFLLNRNEGIRAARGRWLAWNGIPVMPTFHPAYLLRTAAAKRDAWNDLKLVMAALKLPVPERSGR